MITKKAIEIYRKYGGDSDGFCKCSTELERALINSEDWMKIENAVQDICLIDSELSSKEYKTSVLKRLINEFSSEAIELLKKQFHKL